MHDFFENFKPNRQGRRGANIIWHVTVHPCAIFEPTFQQMVGELINGPLLANNITGVEGHMHIYMIDRLTSYLSQLYACAWIGRETLFLLFFMDKYLTQIPSVKVSKDFEQFWKV